MSNTHATPEGTLAWFNKFDTIPHHTIPNLNCRCSTVGFGSYRISEHDEHHETAIKEALDNGINLIDTSSNYGFGQSELLIGKVINECFETRQFLRENIILVSKAGYIQGPMLEDIKEKSKQGKATPDTVKLDEHLWHSIHPEFLAKQIDQSRQRLQVECIDIYLLHNPEYFLEWAHSNGTPIAAARSDYYNRIKMAFEYLETAVKEGKIASYGISSNTFGSPSDQPTHTNLSEILNIAPPTEFPNFAVIQSPFNLIENGAATCQNQDQSKTVLEVAKENQIAFLANRPLNAIVNKELRRLAEKPVEQPVYEDDLNEAIENLNGLEQRFVTNILPVLNADAEFEEQVESDIAISARFQLARQHVNSSQGWQLFVQGQILHTFETLITLLYTNDVFSQMDDHWMTEYTNTLQETLKLFLAYYNNLDAPFSDSMNALIDHLEPEFASHESLSQKAIVLLTNTPGVTTVLVGMRQGKYVEDVCYGVQNASKKQLNLSSWNAINKTLNITLTQDN